MSRGHMLVRLLSCLIGPRRGKGCQPKISCIRIHAFISEFLCHMY